MLCNVYEKIIYLCGDMLLVSVYIFKKIIFPKFNKPSDTDLRSKKKKITG